MYLELNDIKLRVQEILRPIIRESNREGIFLCVLIQVSHGEHLNFDIKQSGPIVERTDVSLTFLASSENHFVSHSQNIDLNDPPKSSELIAFLHQQIENSPSHPSPIEREPLKFTLVEEEKKSDSKLLEASFKDLVFFFQSRFLVDAPKKMLYSGGLSRGIRFEGYIDSGSFKSRGASFYHLNVKMRTPKIQVTQSGYGSHLKELRLSPFRTRLSPYWKSSNSNDKMNSFDTVVLSHQVLAKLAKKCLHFSSQGSSRLWNWLEVLESKSLGIPHLQVEKSTRKHPFVKRVKECFDTWVHPAGSSEVNLDEVISGKTDLIEEALFINDISDIEIQRESIIFFSLGTLLVLQKGRSAKISSGIVRVTVTGEVISSCRSSTSHKLIEVQPGFSLEPSLMVPDYAVLNETKVIFSKLST